MNIRKDDKVVVLSGKDKGKEGTVLKADPKNGKVIVSGVNVATKHQKPRKQGEEGGIIKVQVVCPKCGKATRVGHVVRKVTIAGEEKNKSIRVCKKCGADL